MPVHYCEVCGVLVASGQSGPGTICAQCLASRKVIVNDGSSSDQVAPARIQFTCPTCKSLLQLPPVAKRTKIRCPRCNGEFAMYPDGRIEGASGTVAAAPPPKATTKKLGAQENLLADLKPTADLDALLERVPEKKGDALPSVLDSDQYEEFKDPSSGSNLGRAVGTGSRGEGYRLLPESTGPGDALDLVPDSSDKIDGLPLPKTPAKAPAPELKSRPKIQTARRQREQINEQRKQKADREARAAEAQKYTIALMERKKRRTMATIKLVAVWGAPLLVAGLCLISTVQEGGFAVNGPLGKALGELGEMARTGTNGLLNLFK